MALRTQLVLPWITSLAVSPFFAGLVEHGQARTFVHHDFGVYESVVFGFTWHILHANALLGLQTLVHHLILRSGVALADRCGVGPALENTHIAYIAELPQRACAVDSVISGLVPVSHNDRYFAGDGQVRSGVNNGREYLAETRIHVRFILRANETISAHGILLEVTGRAVLRPAAVVFAYLELLEVHPRARVFEGLPVG